MALETNTHRLTEIIAKYPFPHTIWYHMVNQKEWRFKKKSKRWGDELIYYTLYVPVISKFCVIAFTLAVIVFAWTFWGILSRFIHASPVLITLPDANLKLVFYAFKNFYLDEQVNFRLNWDSYGGNYGPEHRLEHGPKHGPEHGPEHFVRNRPDSAIFMQAESLCWTSWSLILNYSILLPVNSDELPVVIFLSTFLWANNNITTVDKNFHLVSSEAININICHPLARIFYKMIMLASS